MLRQIFMEFQTPQKLLISFLVLFPLAYREREFSGVHAVFLTAVRGDFFFDSHHFRFFEVETATYLAHQPFA